MNATLEKRSREVEGMRQKKVYLGGLIKTGEGSGHKTSQDTAGIG
jgi:hypothetical protein